MRPAQRGFTMVELIVVMIIVGILGAVAAARFFDRSGFDAASYAEQCKAILRYGQKIAIAQQRPVFVLLAGNRVALCYAGDLNCAGADRVPPPSGANSGSSVTVANCGVTDWVCEGRPAGLAMTLNPASATSFYFDSLGRPYAAADTAPISHFATLVLRISGDGANHDVTVVPETGYVY